MLNKHAIPWVIKKMKFVTIFYLTSMLKFHNRVHSLDKITLTCSCLFITSASWLIAENFNGVNKLILYSNKIKN